MEKQDEKVEKQDENVEKADENVEKADDNMEKQEEGVAASPLDSQELREASRVVWYGDLLLKCFDEASKTMEEAELQNVSLPSGTVVEDAEHRETRIKIALALFGKCTRAIPGQDKVFEKAIEYLNLLMKEKIEEMDRRLPLSFPPPWFSASSPDPDCRHPGLWALREALLAGQPEDNFLAVGLEALAAMSVKNATPSGEVDVLMCPQCRALVSLEKFKSGELWDEDAEEPETPPIRSGIGLAGMLSAAVCGHPGLRALHDHWGGAWPGENVGSAEEVEAQDQKVGLAAWRETYGTAAYAAQQIMEAMTLKAPTSPDFLMCTHCKALVPVEMVKSGDLWSDSAEESREAAREPTPRERKQAFYEALAKVNTTGGGVVRIAKRKNPNLGEDSPLQMIQQVEVRELPEYGTDRKGPGFFERLKNDHGVGTYDLTIFDCAGLEDSVHTIEVVDVQEAETEVEESPEAGKPEGQSVADFMKALEEVQETGHNSISIFKGRVLPVTAEASDTRKLDDIEIADVLGDPDFFDSLRSNYGDGVYTFKLWEKNLELHSDYCFILTLAEADEE